MKKNKKISVVVLNYNGLQHLEEYFRSLFSQTLIPDEVIMMDNLSKDGSRKFVANNFPSVKIITEDRYNTGTATASNIGFKATTGNYVIFQSNDLRLDKNCIKELVAMLEKDKKIGICTSVLINYYKDKKTSEHLIDNAGGLMDKYGFGMQNYPAKRIEDIPKEGEVFFSYGGSFIIRREIYKKINGFDDRFFTLGDDQDLSWRTRQLGYKVMYTKKSFVYHKVSATLKINYNRARLRYWSERNSIRTFLKNAPILHFLTSLPMYIALLLGEIIYFLLRGRFAMAWSDIRAIGWNIWNLPDTLKLRMKVQAMKKENNIESLLANKSFKLMLFKNFSKSL